MLNDEAFELENVVVEVLLVDELFELVDVEVELFGVDVEEILDEVAVAVPFQFPKSVNFNTVGSL